MRQDEAPSSAPGTWLVPDSGYPSTDNAGVRGFEPVGGTAMTEPWPFRRTPGFAAPDQPVLMSYEPAGSDESHTRPRRPSQGIFRAAAWGDHTKPSVALGVVPAPLCFHADARPAPVPGTLSPRPVVVVNVRVRRSVPAADRADPALRPPPRAEPQTTRGRPSADGTVATVAGSGAGRVNKATVRSSAKLSVARPRG